MEIAHGISQVTKIKDELDDIGRQKTIARKKKSRPSVPRINLGRLHLRVPVGTLWPFMISQEWYDENIDGNAEREQELLLYAKNPDGFGDDAGYGADDEGGGL
jgi:hypothetical protein